MRQDIVFVARFTGIVPIRCILREWSRKPFTRPVTLIYGSPSEDQLLYHQEFVALTQTHPSFRYMPTIIQRQSMSKDSAELELLRSIWTGEKDFLPMVSGVKEFVRPIRAYLSGLGFDRKEMKFETYD
jgi:phenol hydroxylase P5 protein